MAENLNLGTEFNSEKHLAGLSDVEAASRIARYGFNELPSSKPRSIFRIAFEVVREPMLLLLLACGSTYLLLGDVQEAIILLIFVVGGHRDHAVSGAQNRTGVRGAPGLVEPPRAGGSRRRAQENCGPRRCSRRHPRFVGRRPRSRRWRPAVRRESDDGRIIVDGRIRARSEASRVESIRRWRGRAGTIFHSSSPGRWLFEALGLRSQRRPAAKPNSARSGNRCGRWNKSPRCCSGTRAIWCGCSRWGDLALCGLLVVFYGLTRGDWLRGFLAALTLAMAILPEELPVVLTVFLALGAWRMSRNRVLTRRVPAIEMLGAATALCVDKTGTLTMNRMSVTRLYARVRHTTSANSQSPRFRSSFTNWRNSPCLPASPTLSIRWTAQYASSVTKR